MSPNPKTRLKSEILEMSYRPKYMILVNLVDFYMLPET